MKKIGIIDTGSNTVLGVVFRWDGKKKCYRCFSLDDGLTVHAGLIRYVRDGRLSAEGLAVLEDAYARVRDFFVRMGVENENISCFATASLRGVVNFSDAQQIAARFGWRLELLSGEEEAACDFAGMLQEMEWLEEDGMSFPESGVALDMGGGSGQLLCFTARTSDGLEAFQSFPIGCLALKKRFVSGDGSAPTDAELEKIQEFVLSQIETIPMIAALPSSGAGTGSPPAFFAMGGTVKAIVRLFEALGWPVGGGCVTLAVSDLEKAVGFFRTEEGRALVREKEPGRAETLVTGTVTLFVICRRLGARAMKVLQAGVREGYVIRHAGGRIVEVDETNIREAARVHSISWQESHRAFCTPEFVALHSSSRQERRLREQMADGWRFYLLIKQRPAGIVAVKGDLIEDLYVLPEEHRKGYGSELLHFAMDKCSGVPRLTVLDNNLAARRLYERQGFCLTGWKNKITEGLYELEMRYSMEK